MGQNEDGSNNNNHNFFIRFKNHVDATISSGVKTIFGSSAASSSDPASDPSTKPPSSSSVSNSSEQNLDSTQHPPSIDSRDDPRAMSAIGFRYKGDYPEDAEKVLALTALEPDISPITLRVLPQPTPRGLESHMDSSIFGYEDAFEDLLTASKGLPLRDISTLYKERKAIHDKFPDGEPMFLFFRRLRAKGIMYTPNPEQFSQSDKRFLPALLHQQVERQVADHWGPVSDLERHPDPDDISALQKLTLKTWAFQKKEMDEARAEALRELREGPDSEGDLFDAVRSKFTEAESAWDTFMKSFNQDPSKTQGDRTGGDQSNQTSDKGNSTVERKEYVDRFGMRHVSTTKKIFDEEGNQIGTHTSHKVGPADEAEDESGGLKPAESEEKEHKPRKVGLGWFWGKN